MLRKTLTLKRRACKRNGRCWGCKKNTTSLPFGLLEYVSDAKALISIESNDDYVSKYERLVVGTTEGSDDNPDLECPREDQSKPTESFDFAFDVENEEKHHF